LKNSVIQVGKDTSRGDNMNGLRFFKIWGKLQTYIGFLIAIAGIEYVNVWYATFGVVCIIIGCLMHEVAEK